MCVEIMYSWYMVYGEGGELEESEKEAPKLISESGIRRERTTLIKEIAWYTCTRPYNAYMQSKVNE